MAIISASASYLVDGGAPGTTSKKRVTTPVRTKSKKSNGAAATTTSTVTFADDLSRSQRDIMPSLSELRGMPPPPPPPPPPPAVRKGKRSSLLANFAVRRVVKSLVGLNNKHNGLVTSEYPKAGSNSSSRRPSAISTVAADSPPRASSPWQDDDLDAVSSVRRHSAPEGGGAGVPERRQNTTVRSGARSLKGRRYEGKANEDRLFAIDDLFGGEATAAAATAAATSYSAPPGTCAAAAVAAAASAAAMAAATAAKAAAAAAVVGKVGAYGVFDGHGGSGCAEYVSRHLPAAIASSSAWARLDPCRMIADETERKRCRQGRAHEEATGIPMTLPCGAPVLLPCGAPRHTRDFLSDEFDDLMGAVMEDALLDGFEKTQRDFAIFAERRGDMSGSTAVVALVCMGRLVVANLGDSEGLFHSDLMFGASHTTRTKLHNMENPAEKRRVEAAGGIFGNGRLFGMLQPTRSFGDEDIHRIKRGVLIAEPEVRRHRIESTVGLAFLVLGSDGLWASVPEEKLMKTIRLQELKQSKRKEGEMCPQRIAETLTQESVKKGEGDDVTALVVFLN